MTRRRKLYRVFVVLNLAAIAFLLWRLQRLSASDYIAPGDGPDVQAQLNWIAAELRHGGAERTQAWYPEGYFFAHVLYGYTLVNQVLLNPDDADLRARNIAEIEWVLQHLESEAARAPFPQAQAVPYGVFYQGWLNRLLGGWLLLQTEDEREAARVAQFHRQSEALASAFRASPTHQLEAYADGCWPVDNIVALSSLRLHDALYGARYEPLIDEWLAYTRGHLLDPQTGLFAHRIDALTGDVLRGSRGSSLVLGLVFLPEIDVAFADDQYRRFRERYAQPFLDFVLMREYAHGVSGPGDVDSGPLIFDTSAVVTVVSMAAARANGDVEIFERVLQLAEVVGLPITFGDAKRYYLGTLVVADEFQVWGKTIVSWVDAARSFVPKDYPRLTATFPIGSYAIALAWIGLLWWPLVRANRRRNVVTPP